MGLITLVLVLALVGFIVYLLTTFVPMPPIFKTIIYVAVAVVLILFFMRVFGIADIPIGR